MRGERETKRERERDWERERERERERTGIKNCYLMLKTKTQFLSNIRAVIAKTKCISIVKYK